MEMWQRALAERLLLGGGGWVQRGELGFPPDWELTRRPAA